MINCNMSKNLLDHSSFAFFFICLADGFLYISIALYVAVTGFVGNLVTAILFRIKSLITEIVPQQLRCDDIRLLVEYLVDFRRCHSIILTAHKEIQTL